MNIKSANTGIKLNFFQITFSIHEFQTDPFSQALLSKILYR